MTNEEIEQLKTLLEKAAEESQVLAYDANEENYSIDWCIVDNNKLYIRLEKI